MPISVYLHAYSCLSAGLSLSIHGRVFFLGFRVYFVLRVYASCCFVYTRVYFVIVSISWRVNYSEPHEQDTPEADK